MLPSSCHLFVLNADLRVRSVHLSVKVFICLCSFVGMPPVLKANVRLSVKVSVGASARFGHAKGKKVIFDCCCTAEVRFMYHICFRTSFVVFNHPSHGAKWFTRNEWNLQLKGNDLTDAMSVDNKKYGSSHVKVGSIPEVHFRPQYAIIVVSCWP